MGSYRHDIAPLLWESWRRWCFCSMFIASPSMNPCLLRMYMLVNNAICLFCALLSIWYIISIASVVTIVIHIVAIKFNCFHKCFSHLMRFSHGLFGFWLVLSWDNSSSDQKLFRWTQECRIGRKQNTAPKKLLQSV